MKRYHLLFVLLFSIIQLQAAPAPVRWALTNLSQSYSYRDFHNGMAVCCNYKTQKYGAIDTNGKLVIAANYDYLSDFNGNCAIARNNKGVGIINTDNEYVLPPQHNRKILPIISKDNFLEKPLKDAFLVIDNEQTQAVFYKDVLITEFQSIQSMSLEIHFPFIMINNEFVLNTENGDVVKIIEDMGGYYLVNSETNNQLYAISHNAGSNISYYVLATIYKLQKDYFSNRSLNTYSIIKYSNGIWQVLKKNGKIKLSLREDDGWICKYPFFQCNVIWFERKIPKSGETQIKIFNTDGIEIFKKSTTGTFTVKLFPEYYISSYGYVRHTYDSPTICVTEIPTNKKNAKSYSFSTANYKKKYVSDANNDGDYYVCNNHLFTKSQSSFRINNMLKKKKQTAKEIVSFSDNMAIVKNTRSKYFAVNVEKSIPLYKYDNVYPFNEGVAVAVKKDKKVIYNNEGKIIMQDCKDYKIIGSQSSENVILLLDKKTNKYCYAYSPLVHDVLQYDTEAKTKQYYSEGINCYNRGNYNQASYYFKALHYHYPKEVRYIIDNADCYYYSGQYNSAISWYEDALSITPQDREVQEKLEKAKNYQRQAVEAAEQSYKEALANLNNLAQQIASGQYSTQQSASTTSTSSNTNNKSKSNSKSNTQSSTSNNSTQRDDTNYRFKLMEAYGNYESQLMKMSTHPNTYNATTRVFIQSKMKSIRTELERRGYQARKSSWEDWPGCVLKYSN